MGMTDTQSHESGVKAAILDAARHVLATAGYSGFTIAAVAAQAGLDPTIMDRW